VTPLRIALGTAFVTLWAFGLWGDSKSAPVIQASETLTYTTDGRLEFPKDYREWIYLSSGVDMSYTPQAEANGHPVFDNVFANPAAYRSFLRSGVWPDRTILVLEVRESESDASINKRGHSQSQKISGIEVHVKDNSKGGWAFYDFNGTKPGKKFAPDANCYSCHRDHGAVDTTFVQFYPTLLPIANQKGTLAANTKSK
jgi:hypothetical protein